MLQTLAFNKDKNSLVTGTVRFSINVFTPPAIKYSKYNSTEIISHFPSGFLHRHESF